MPAHFLIRHWKKELQVFHEKFLILQKSLDPEAVHDLRVSFKKLRSYAKFYSAIFKKDKTQKILAKTKTLFSVLGKQRNVEMGLELLNRSRKKDVIEIRKHFKLYLKETQDRSRAVLQQYKTDELRSLTIKIEKNVSLTDEESIKQNLLELMRSSINETSHFLKDFDKTYHLVRKQLKDVFYWSHLLTVGFYFSNQQLKTLKAILDDLGDAQDHEVLRTNLRHYRKTIVVKGNEAFNTAKKIEKEANEYKRRLLNEASKMIKLLLKGNKKSDPEWKDRFSAPERS